MTDDPEGRAGVYIIRVILGTASSVSFRGPDSGAGAGCRINIAGLGQRI